MMLLGSDSGDGTVHQQQYYEAFLRATDPADSPP